VAAPPLRPSIDRDNPARRPASPAAADRAEQQGKPAQQGSDRAQDVSQRHLGRAKDIARQGRGPEGRPEKELPPQAQGRALGHEKQAAAEAGPERQRPEGQAKPEAPTRGRALLEHVQAKRAKRQQIREDRNQRRTEARSNRMAAAGGAR
jgi:hypothetical protein